MFRLDNKTVLVTGAGSGIGAAIADIFARAGAFVYATDRDAATADQTAAHITAGGGKAASFALDITSEAACAVAEERVTKERGHLDILVNNAGVGMVGTMLHTSGSDLDRIYAVNVRGTFNLTKAFLPGMITHKAGVIVNIASIAGVLAIKDRLAYTTTKFAVVGLTKAIALDHALDGIRANCICPGRVETPWVTQRLKEYPDPEKAYREMAATQAQGRMGRPEEIAAAALYLASDEAAFVTGSALIIDGGLSVGK